MSELKKDVFMHERETLDPVYAVFYGNESLTVPIYEKETAEFAYNILHAMADNGVLCNVNGEPAPFDKDSLIVADNEGHEFKPELDTEWRKDFSHEPGVEEYTIVSQEKDGDRLYFAPVTSDKEKAYKMEEFMHLGIDSSISFAVVDKNGVQRELPIMAFTVDQDGKVQQYEPEEEEEFLGDNAYEDDDFARAVGTIIPNDSQMEQ